MLTLIFELFFSPPPPSQLPRSHTALAACSPTHPWTYPWHELYPRFLAPGDDVRSASTRKVEFADVGCGYGGLLIALSPLYPDTLMLGMEIRTKVSSFVHERIRASRAADDTCHNVAVCRTNAMKYLPNFFLRAQLSKIFFLFPDPHFKTKNHKRRIISATLLAEYAYVLRVGGRLYTVTDVLALHEWMVKHLDAHPLFERIPNDMLADDPAVGCCMRDTEEGKKVERNAGDKYCAVYVRRE